MWLYIFRQFIHQIPSSPKPKYVSIFLLWKDLLVLTFIPDAQQSVKSVCIAAKHRILSWQIIILFGCMVYNLWDSLSSKLRWQLHIILHSVIKHKVEENHSASQHFLLFTKKYQNKPLTVAPPQKHSQLHCWSHLLCKSVSLTWH